MKELKLSVPDDKAQVFAKEMMELMRKHDVQVEGLDSLLPITERVKTFEDACKELGDNNPLVIQFKEIYDNYLCEGGDGVKDIVAVLKLRIIVAALNEGWRPKFTEDEYRYFPWFVFYTQEELDGMDEEDKKGIRVLGRSSANARADAGVACSGTGDASSYSGAGVGGRLCFKNRALAEYAGQQFLAEYMDFIFCE